MFLKSSDAEILVSSYGSAARTFVAHGGWVGSGELWAAPFEQLSRSWRTVTYDHRGTGATRSTAPGITMELLVSDLFRVLDALEIDTCVLAAESMGAMVALKALQRQIQKVRDDMKQNHQLFLDKLITPQGFANLYNPAEQRLNQMLGELPKLEADVCRLKVDQVSVEEVVFEAQHLYEQWPKMDVDRKRAIVESIFEKVEIGEGKINITYSGLPSSEELCKSQQQMAPATG